MFDLNSILRRYEAYVRDLDDLIEENINKAAEKLEHDLKQRIFEDGQDSGGNKIGEYSTKPITVQKKIFIKPSAFKGNKSMKLKYGYKELREIQSLPAEKVHLEYSGKLRAALKVRREKLSLLVGVGRDQAAKAHQLQRKYGPIFNLSTEEKRKFTHTITDGLQNIHRNYFGKA